MTLELVHDAVENLVVDGEPPPVPRRRYGRASQRTPASAPAMRSPTSWPQ